MNHKRELLRGPWVGFRTLGETAVRTRNPVEASMDSRRGFGMEPATKKLSQRLVTVGTKPKPDNP